MLIWNGLFLNLFKIICIYEEQHVCYNCYDKNRGLLQLSDDCGNYFSCSEKLKHKMETNTRLKFQSNSTKLIAVFLEVEYMKDVSVHQIWLTASSHEILIHEIKTILHGQHTSFQLHIHTQIFMHTYLQIEKFSITHKQILHTCVL